MIWKEFKCYYRTFEVNKKGRIRNENGVILKGTMHRNGFRVMNLRLTMDNGLIINHSLLMHRVVAKCWVENPELKPYVIHKDGDLLNNKADNLAWATEEEKVIHQKALGKHGKPKLTALDVLKIRKKIKKGGVLNQIAQDFNVSHTQIHRIKNGENWV